MPSAKKPVEVTEVTKTGNLCDDPHLQFAPSGQPYARFRIAVNTPTEMDDEGRPNWKGPMEADFYDVTCFASLAENCSESLSKGDRVVVNGRPELREYEGSDGENHTSKAIIANNVGVELRFASVKINKTSRRTTAASTPVDSTF